MVHELRKPSVSVDPEKSVMEVPRGPSTAAERGPKGIARVLPANVYVCMYVKLPPEATLPSSPDGRWDCELSTSPLPNARRHTIFSVVDCESSLDYIIELPCGRMQPAVPEAYLERVATMNY